MGMRGGRAGGSFRISYQDRAERMSCSRGAEGEDAGAGPSGEAVLTYRERKKIEVKSSRGSR